MHSNQLKYTQLPEQKDSLSACYITTTAYFHLFLCLFVDLCSPEASINILAFCTYGYLNHIPPTEICVNLLYLLVIPNPTHWKWKHISHIQNWEQPDSHMHFPLSQTCVLLSRWTRETLISFILDGDGERCCGLISYLVSVSVIMMGL